jgi:hypothetical protein
MRRFRTSCILAPDQRCCIARLEARPDLVTVSYRFVDEATGKAHGNTYFAGKRLPQIHVWVTGEDEGNLPPNELWVWSSSDRPLAIDVTAWCPVQAEDSR